MCRLAERCGARVDGGTWMPPLLKAASQESPFRYRTTSKNTELLSHLQRGGAAIIHAGDSYPLFSTSGHFLAAVAADGQQITLLDSYWYNGKYTASAMRRRNITVVKKGVIHTDVTQCGKATADRSPSYYLIEKLSAPVIQNEEEEMTYYETLDEIPAHYRTAVQFLTDAGVISGIGNGKLHLSEDTCRVLTILYKGGYLHAPTQYFNTIDALPTYCRASIQKLIDSNALSGIDTDHLHLSEDMCRILTILDRAQQLS